MAEREELFSDENIASTLRQLATLSPEMFFKCLVLFVERGSEEDPGYENLKNDIQALLEGTRSKS